MHYRCNSLAFSLYFVNRLFLLCKFTIFLLILLELIFTASTPHRIWWIRSFICFTKRLLHRINNGNIKVLPLWELWFLFRCENLLPWWSYWSTSRNATWVREYIEYIEYMEYIEYIENIEYIEDLEFLTERYRCRGSGSIQSF